MGSADTRRPDIEGTGDTEGPGEPGALEEPAAPGWPGPGSVSEPALKIDLNATADTDTNPRFDPENTCAEGNVGYLLQPIDFEIWAPPSVLHGPLAAIERFDNKQASFQQQSLSYDGLNAD